MPNHDDELKMDAEVALRFAHRVRFTEGALSRANPVLAEVVKRAAGTEAKALVVIDQGVARALPGIADDVRGYFKARANDVALLVGVREVAGGEAAKNDRGVYEQVLGWIDEAKLCRWSCVVAIGGGAMLDAVGFAAATAHRGVRLVRLPTTTLAQADSGLGVKNGINWRGKKNFLGSFAVPWAVVNDSSFLRSLPDRDWRCGLSEVVKVALLKSAALFDRVQANADRLAVRDEEAGRVFWRESARLHLEHIATGGDPFEMTEARPLDFGHWAGHKLEQVSRYQLRHGEAVAIGLALDVTYAAMMGIASESLAERVRQLLVRLGFDLYHDGLANHDQLLQGLEEFREHLGGQLTVTLVRKPGEAVHVHEIDRQAMQRAAEEVAALAMRSSIG